MGRKQYDKEIKAQVALVVMDQKTASEYGIQVNQISNWKKQLVESVADVFFSKQLHPARMI